MRQHNALSAVEILLVLATLGTLASLIPLAIKDGATTDARRLTSILVRLRATAVTSGYPRTAAGTPCAAGSPPSAAVMMPSSVVAWPPRGLLFTPDGLPRTCDGGIGNTTILLEYRGRQAAVIVSSLGRVRWEPR